MTPIEFLRDERATITVEGIVAMPVLLWIFAASVMWWDGYRTSMTAQKSTFTISDLISRRTGSIDQGYIDGMNQMFGFLTNEGSNTSIRVTIVSKKLRDDGSDSTYRTIEWSHVSGTHFAPLTRMRDISTHIPYLAVGRQMIVVETHLDWAPKVRTGMPAVDTTTLVTTNPRTPGPQMLWDDGSGSV